METCYLVTGGAGFIGSAVVRQLVLERKARVVVVDKLTYSGNLASLEPVWNDPLFRFAPVDIADRAAIGALYREHQPGIVLNLAAESHVDRSIDAPGVFLETNVMGTYGLLEATRAYWQDLPETRRSGFRFHHVSTDEVYGDLDPLDPPADEHVAYAPSSPYSASKAASDHLVHAWHRTYGLPVSISNCSNNYGPYHFPEKLIPHMILSAIGGKPLPVYGDGLQVRDWLHVQDHVDALLLIAERGRTGEVYNVGGGNEVANLDVIRNICAILEEMAPNKRPAPGGFETLITFVKDRPGHDRRYAIDAGKLKRELGWKPRRAFADGLRQTVAWYLENRSWWEPILDGSYRLSRLGTGE